MYLTAKDVARLLGISVRSVWRLTAAGDLPRPAQLGKRVTRWEERAVRRTIERTQR